MFFAFQFLLNFARLANLSALTALAGLTALAKLQNLLYIKDNKYNAKISSFASFASLVSFGVDLVVRHVREMHFYPLLLSKRMERICLSYTSYNKVHISFASLVKADKLANLGVVFVVNVVSKRLNAPQSTKPHLSTHPSGPLKKIAQTG